MTTRADTTLEETDVSSLSPGDLRVLVPDFKRSLRARNLSPRTVDIYGNGADLFVRFLVETGLPTEARKITRDSVEMFIERQLARAKPATAAQRYKAVGQLFKWLGDEGEVPESPLRNMHAPKIPEELVPVLDHEQLRRLLATASTKSFVDVRDRAIMLLMIDSGMRLGEVSGLKLEDVDRDLQVAYVLGKGRRPRSCPFGAKANEALSRYLRLRAQQKYASLPWLWITRQGRTTDSGIRQAIVARGNEAGLGHIHPHMLRHSFAHDALANGMAEGDLMMLAGWRSSAMLRRYGAAQAADRAKDAYRRIGGQGDRL
jgi:site-specific recombinase XerD